MNLILRLACFVFLLTSTQAEQLVIVSMNKDQKIAVYELNPTEGSLTLKNTVSLNSGPGPMCLDPSGTHLYVGKAAGSIATYVAKRGYNAIAGFAVDEEEGTLSPISHTPTEPVTRSFNIAPDGKHLIAAGQRSGNLAVFRIGEDGLLTRTSTIDGLLTRTSTIAAGMNPWWVQVVER